jgi:hypothetical protein
LDVAHDELITDRARAAGNNASRALRQLLDEAEGHAPHLRRELRDNLRAPLREILVNCNLLLDECRSQRARAAVSAIEQLAVQCKRIVSGTAVVTAAAVAADAGQRSARRAG